MLPPFLPSGFFDPSPYPRLPSFSLFKRFQAFSSTLCFYALSFECLSIISRKTTFVNVFFKVIYIKLTRQFTLLKALYTISRKKLSIYSIYCIFLLFNVFYQLFTAVFFGYLPVRILSLMYTSVSSSPYLFSIISIFPRSSIVSGCII